MSAETKTCLNCWHNHGRGMNSVCPRVGYFCTTEMQFGGRCGPDMKLWEPTDPTDQKPQRTFWMRLTDCIFLKNDY